MRDPYLVLGISKSASAAEIKKTYRRLAKKFHPDQSKEPKAKEKFAEVSAAYEILGDEKKRAAFDKGEIDAEGKPRFHGFEGFGAEGFGRRSQAGAGPGSQHFEFNFGGAGPGAGGFAANDIFADLFGAGGMGGARRGRTAGQGAPRGEDIAAEVTITLAEVAKGTAARVALATGRTLEVSVPTGIEDGKQIRLKGQGQPSAWGGEPGDAWVTVHIAKHPYFRVEGRDLRLDLPVTLYEAVNGAKVTAPTLEGTVEITVPPHSSAGRTLRLRGKGLPGAQGPAGDLLVSLKIVLPGDADPELAALMRKWEEQKPYNPRAGMK